MAADVRCGAFLALAAVLLLANLGSSGLLWQDEAETALLARHTRVFGYPRASDDHGLIELPSGYRYGPGQAWLYSPWLPFYLLAGVFAITGESTWAARWPFALFGWLTIWLTWRLCAALTNNRRIHLFTVALLTCSVPFLLHMRQCRYYALAAFLLVAVCLAYLRMVALPTGRRVGALGAALVALFYANFGTCLPAGGALFMHGILRGVPRLRSERRRVWIMWAMVAGLTLPWMVFTYQPALMGTPSLARAAKHLEYYVRITNKHLVPLAFMAGVSTIWWLIRAHPLRLKPIPMGVQVVALMALSQAAFLLLPDQRHMRYLIPTLPLLIIGQAWWLSRCLARAPRLGWVVALAMLTTNALQSRHVRVPLMDVAYELTHRYRGPMEGVVEYLNAHAKAGDTAKIPYDDHTLMWYTALTVEPPSRFQEQSDPDWIIVRREWMPRGFFESPYFRRIEARYERIELDAPDVLWQNREDPGSHQFRTVAEAPRVVIYRKRI